MNYALHINLGLAAKMVKVNPDSPFVHTWQTTISNFAAFSKITNKEPADDSHVNSYLIFFGN